MNNQQCLRFNFQSPAFDTNLFANTLVGIYENSFIEIKM